MPDIVIKNGKVADGTGKPCFCKDIGIKGKYIATIGDINCSGATVIDAKGMIVCPGFIDVHSHSDLAVLKPETKDFKIRQGVTTEVVGNCGFSPAPTSYGNALLLKNFIKPIIGNNEDISVWNKTSGYIQQLQKKDLPHNIGVLVGNGSLRIGVKGFDKSPLSYEEFKKVEYYLKEAMEAGALGLSLGLMYAPENYYTTDELIRICSILKEYDALFTAHIRGEGQSLISSIKEVLYIAEKTGVSLEISHIKVAGKSNREINVKKAINLIEKAKARGVNVSCDVYPYTAGSSTLASLFPPEILEGGFLKAKERLKNKKIRNKIIQELEQEQKTWDNLVYSTGWDSVIISSVGKNMNKHTVGHSILSIAKKTKMQPAECALDLYLKDEGQTGIVFFHMSETDVGKFISWENTIIASDSIFNSQGKPHPRLYGTFPRVFARYVRDKGVLTLEEAVRKATSFPAEKFKLNKRGKIEEGNIADIVVFDPKRIQDLATYEKPEQFPIGIQTVILGGKIAYNDGISSSLSDRNSEVIKRSL